MHPLRRGSAGGGGVDGDGEIRAGPNGEADTVETKEMADG